MRISHRVSIASSAEICSELAAFGVSVAANGLVTFEVDESDPSWPSIQTWAQRRHAVDVPNTTFTAGELGAAEWLELVPDWHHGYPQPADGEFGFLRETYDMSDYCDACGLGLRQIAPFRMKGEPKWGQREVLQLNWVFDEFFVTPDISKLIFEPHGIDSRVVVGSRGESLKTVVQLNIADVADVATHALVGETCERCGRVRFEPPARGFFPHVDTVPSVSKMAKTRQWFGSGFSAHHRVLVAQELCQALAAKRTRGASFRPCEE